MDQPIATLEVCLYTLLWKVKMAFLEHNFSVLMMASIFDGNTRYLIIHSSRYSRIPALGNNDDTSKGTYCSLLIDSLYL